MKLHNNWVNIQEVKKEHNNYKIFKKMFCKLKVKFKKLNHKVSHI